MVLQVQGAGMELSQPLFCGEIIIKINLIQLIFNHFDTKISFVISDKSFYLGGGIILLRDVLSVTCMFAPKRNANSK